MTGFEQPTIDWAALSPELILLGGASLCLVLALFLPWSWRQPFCAAVAALSLIGAGAAAVVLFTMDDTATGIVADALQRDRLAELAQILIVGSGLLAVGVSFNWERDERTRGRVPTRRATRRDHELVAVPPDRDGDAVRPAVVAHRQ